MGSQKPGRIRDSLWYLGHPESGVYLLEGRKESMIISGGVRYIVPSLMEQIQKVGLKEDQIGNILILDHECQPSNRLKRTILLAIATFTEILSSKNGRNYLRQFRD